jgi:hypothetical protein
MKKTLKLEKLVALKKSVEEIAKTKNTIRRPEIYEILGKQKHEEGTIKTLFKIDRFKTTYTMNWGEYDVRSILRVLDYHLENKLAKSNKRMSKANPKPINIDASIDERKSGKNEWLLGVIDPTENDIEDEMSLMGTYLDMPMMEE